MNLKSISLLVGPLVILMPASLVRYACGAPPAPAGDKATQAAFASAYQRPADDDSSSVDSDHDRRSGRHGLKRTLLASGLQGSIGSAIGPDGALYVPEGIAGTVTRIDLETGA